MDTHIPFADKACLKAIVAHMNAPYGPILTVGHVEQALRAGSLAVLGGEPRIRDILGGLFVECSAETIGIACLESGVDIDNGHHLYLELINTHNQPRVMEWEDAVRELV